MMTMKSHILWAANRTSIVHSPTEDHQRSYETSVDFYRKIRPLYPKR
jgi:hypothetical protein